MTFFKSIFSNLDKNTLKKYAIVYGFSILGALFNMWFFRAALYQIDQESFFYYSYARRAIAFIYPILFLGFGVALPRFIGFYNSDDKKSREMFIVSFIVIAISTGVWLLLNVINPRFFSQLIWGSSSDFVVRLNTATSLFIFGFALFGVIFAYYRGRLMVKTAGVLEFIVVSILPAIAFLSFHSLADMYLFLGIVMILLNLVIATSIIFNKLQISYNNLVLSFKELFGYGIKRVPGDISFALLLFLPAFLVNHYFGIEYAGIVGFGAGLITFATLPATAISFVSLSRSAQLLKIDKQGLKREIMFLTILLLIYSVICTLGLYITVDFIVEKFLSVELVKYSYILKIMILSIPPFVVFTILRSVIDAAYRRPYISYYVVVTTIIFVLMSGIGIYYSSLHTIIAAIIVSYTILALLALRRMYLIFIV
ncbi:MAG: hypothetical protein JXA53_00040 [Bacteroidales bacterium]|nr:hypothetical protein [Bacteroidales bacterium]